MVSIFVWDRFGGGYRFEPQRRAGPKHAGPKHQLPGLWFNSSEAYALLAMQQLLKEIDPGILAGQIEPLAVRLRALLGSSGDDIAEVEKRIKLLQVGARRANPQHFSHIARAVLTRRPNHKSADPLHLTRQRRSHRPPDLAAAPGQLPRQHFPIRARWVAHENPETWHPQQKGVFEADGSYLLTFPVGAG